MKIHEVRISGDINIKSQWLGHGWKARGTATFWSVFSWGPTATNGRKTTATSVILDFCQCLYKAAFASISSFSENSNYQIDEIKNTYGEENFPYIHQQRYCQQISSLSCLWLRIDHKQIMHCLCATKIARP